MAHLWVTQNKDGSITWAIAPLKGSEIFELGQDHMLPLVGRQNRHGKSVRPVVQRGRIGEAETWVLISPPGVSALVNGTPVLPGIKVLADRDEIRIAGTSNRLFYSTERLARVEPFPGCGQPMSCQRCKQPITKGSPVVRCPQPRCQVLHHQSEELNCWTYSDRCSNCDQPTELDAGYRWTPEGL